jgi:hypothetical protein
MMATSERLETYATRLLIHSLTTLGRGDHPFYSEAYLQSMADREALCPLRSHCRPGHEACRRDGLCARRWPGSR